MAAERGQSPADGDPQADGDPRTARSRLAALQDRAADAYAAVTAADAELRVLASRRVAAERVLRRALLAADAADAVRDASRVASRARDEFAAGLAARAEAVSALRRLTADCAAARAQVTGEGDSAGDERSG